MNRQQPTAAAPPAPTRLGFDFRLSGDAGKLSVENREFFGWLHIDRLELDLPSLKLPVDLASGPEVFQRHRSRVRIASMRIDQRELNRFVATRATTLAELGVDQLQLHVNNEHIAASCRVRADAHVADLTFRVVPSRPAPDSQRLQLVVTNERCYGFLPTPAPLLAHRIFSVMLCGSLDAAVEPASSPAARRAASFPPVPATSPPTTGRQASGIDSTRGNKRGIAITGLGVAELSPLDMFLWSTLPAAGWRLPSTRKTNLIAVRVARSCLELIYAHEARDAELRYRTEQAELPGSEPMRIRQRFKEAEKSHRDGDFERAIRALRGELASGLEEGATKLFAVERLLAITSTQQNYFPDAVELARRTLGRHPYFAPAHAALASVCTARGEWKRAAHRFAILAENGSTIYATYPTLDGADGAQHSLEKPGDQSADDDECRMRAALAGARLLRTADPVACTPLYEKVYELRPHNAEASEALADRYFAEQRWRELVRLIHERVEATNSPAQQARDLVRCAEILASELNDAAAAADDLVRATTLDSANLDALLALARLEEERGAWESACRALESAAALETRPSDRLERAILLARAAEASRRMGELGRAEANYTEALDADPANEAALSGAAAVFEERGAHREAIALWHKLIAASTANPESEARYYCELGRSLLASGDQKSARTALSRAADAAAPETRANARALLAQAREKVSDRVGAAAELADAVSALLGAAEQSESGRAADLCHRAASLALQRAEHLRSIGDTTAALAGFELVISLAGKSESQLAKRAASALLSAAEAANDDEAQLRWLNELLGGDSGAPDASSASETDIDASTNQPDRTDRDTVVDPSTSRARLLCRRAQLHSRAGSHQSALADVDAALAARLAPTARADALATRADLLAATGDHAGQARALAMRANLLDPRDALANDCSAARAWIAADEPAAALESARRAVERALSLETPANAAQQHASDEAYQLLADTAWVQRAWNDVVRGLEPLLDANASTQLAAERLCHYGVALRAIGRTDSALRALARLIESEDPNPTVASIENRTRALRELAELYQGIGDRARAARSLEAYAASAADIADSARGDAWYRAGELYIQYSRTSRASRSAVDAPDARADDDNHSADAERCLEAALHTVPDHLPALDALERIKRGAGDMERVAVILGRKIAATTRYPMRQKALLIRLAELQWKQLGRTDVARETFARALELDPNSRPALTFCAADAEARGDIESAIELQQRLSLALESDNGSAVVASTDASPHLGNSLNGSSDLLVARTNAIEALARIHRSRGDWGELANTLARLAALAHARGDAARAQRLREQVKALSGEPSSPQGHAHAIEALSAGDVASLGDDELVNLATSYQQLLRHQDAIAALERARQTRPLPDEAEMLLFALHRTREQEAEHAAAAESKAESLAASGRDSAIELALVELRRALHLYEHSLRDMSSSARVRARMAAFTNESGAAVAHRLAYAIGEHARALAGSGETLDETLTETLDELRTVARRGGHYATLADGLMTAAAVEGDAGAAKALLRETATIMRTHLDDPAGAADALNRAMSKGPIDATLMADLDDVLRELGDFNRLSSAYEQFLESLEGTARAMPLARLARIRNEIFGEADAAAKLLLEAHQLDNECSDVWLPLAGLLLAAGDFEAARELFSRALAFMELDAVDREAIEQTVASINAERSGANSNHENDAENDADAANYRSDSAPSASSTRALAPVEIAERVERELLEELARGTELERQGDREAAIVHFIAASTLAPEDRRPLVALERTYYQLGDIDALGEVLGRLVNLSADGPTRARLWQRRAHLYRDVLHREAETYSCLKEAYANDPNNGELANELRIVAMVRGEWALGAELLYTEIAAAPNRSEAGALHHELALIFDEKLLDPDQARLNYEQALALDPEIPAAPQPLARLYELAGRFEDAASMSELAAERCRTENERGRLLQRAAMNAERAELADDARRLYNLAALTVEDEEESRAAQAALARLSRIANDPISSTELLELRLSEETNVERRVDLLREALDSSSNSNPSSNASYSAETIRFAEALLKLAPDDTSAYRVLKRRATAEEAWDDLALIMDRRASATADPIDRAARFYELGRLYLDHAHDVNAAVMAFEEALAADVDHPAALESVANIAYSKADWTKAHELYGRLRPEVCSMSTDALWFRRGEVAEALSYEQHALEAFTTAVSLAPSNRNALSAQARVAIRLGEARMALGALQSLVELLPPDDIKAITGARQKLGELSQELGELPAAVAYFEQVVAEEPRSPRALRALVELYTQSGNALAAVRALSILTGLAATTGEQAELLYYTGEVYREQLHDTDLAADCFLKAIDLDPNHAPTLRRLVDYYWRIEDDTGLEEVGLDLLDQGTLSETEPGALGRMLVSAGLRSNAALIRAITTSLADAAATVLVDGLLEAAARRDSAALALAAAASTICQAATAISAADLYARASASAPDSELTAALLAQLSD